MSCEYYNVFYQSEQWQLS